MFLYIFLLSAAFRSALKITLNILFSISASKAAEITAFSVKRASKEGGLGRKQQMTV